MQRYSGGLKVPKIMIEHFSGTSSSPSGFITVTLKYPPTSIEDIIIEGGFDLLAGNPRAYFKYSLSGTSLVLFVSKPEYEKADTPTDIDVGSSGAPANHSHGLTYSLADVTNGAAGNEDEDPIDITYKVG